MCVDTCQNRFIPDTFASVIISNLSIRYVFFFKLNGNIIFLGGYLLWKYIILVVFDHTKRHLKRLFFFFFLETYANRTLNKNHIVFWHAHISLHRFQATLYDRIFFLKKIKNLLHETKSMMSFFLEWFPGVFGSCVSTV